MEDILTSEERIAKHRNTITDIREEIKWLESSKFEMTSASNAELIEKAHANIKMYVGIINSLQDRL